MFRFKDGHVDYRTRYARTQRWKAQHAARQSLFGMYRNPTTDDPRVAGLSRGTANTQLFHHHGKLLVFKEDSPPVAMNPLTLETTDDYYTFGGKLQSKTHTAHPKIDPVTGEYVSFGYEAKGLASDDIYVFSGRPWRQHQLGSLDQGSLRGNDPRLCGHPEAHRLLHHPARHQRGADPGGAGALRLIPPCRATWE